MSVVKEPEVTWNPDQMVEVTLNEPCLLYTSPSPRDA